MNYKKNYLDIPDEYAKLETAKIVLIPVPYDGTSTWQKGADKGPEAFLEASESLELYDIETGTEVYKEGIYLASPVSELETPEQMVKSVYATTKSYITKNKFVTLVGGEHSISIGALRAFNECFDNLSILHIDAHADLRPEYLGTRYNHACAVYEASQEGRLVQVGIRSMDKMEVSIMDKEKVFFAHEMLTNEYWIDDVIDQLSDNVYVTFDLDAFDPSILPSTGTPEPGGMLWYETLTLLQKVFAEKNVVGFDIVELCPNPTEKSSDFVAAKLYYKMLSYKFSKENSEENETFDNGSHSNQINKVPKFKINIID